MSRNTAPTTDRTIPPNTTPLTEPRRGAPTALSGAATDLALGVGRLCRALIVSLRKTSHITNTARKVQSLKVVLVSVPIW